MSANNQCDSGAYHEGAIIRLKQFFGVETDEELSSVLGYSRSSISLWRHSGMTERTAKKISSQHKEAQLTSDFILYGSIISDGTDGLDMRSTLLRNAKRERLPYLIAHIQSSLGTKDALTTFKALFEIDTKASLEKNKPITLLSYDKNTTLPLFFLEEVLANKGFYRLSYNPKRNHHELLLDQEFYKKDVARLAVPNEQSRLFSQYELKVVNEICNKLAQG